MTRKLYFCQPGFSSGSPARPDGAAPPVVARDQPGPWPRRAATPFASGRSGGSYRLPPPPPPLAPNGVASEPPAGDTLWSGGGGPAASRSPFRARTEWVCVRLATTSPPRWRFLPLDPPSLLSRTSQAARSLGASTDGTGLGPAYVGPPAPLVRAAPLVTRFVWSVPSCGGSPIVGHVAESWVSIPPPPRPLGAAAARLGAHGCPFPEPLCFPLLLRGGAARIWSCGLKVGAIMASPGKRREMDLMKLYVAPELRTASGPR